jgi:hypothetical protein
MNENFCTSDLALAAFLLTKGLKLLVAKRLPTGRYHFEIEDSDNICDRLKIEFVNSEFMNFDNNLKMLKKMIYS